MTENVLHGDVSRRIRRLERDLKKCSDRIAKERNRLRELVSEYQSIEESCDDALDMIERAADKLSELL